MTLCRNQIISTEFVAITVWDISLSGLLLLEKQLLMPLTPLKLCPTEAVPYAHHAKLIVKVFMMPIMGLAVKEHVARMSPTRREQGERDPKISRVRVTCRQKWPEHNTKLIP